MILLGFQEPKLMYGGFGSDSAQLPELTQMTPIGQQQSLLII